MKVIILFMLMLVSAATREAVVDKPPCLTVSAIEIDSATNEGRVIKILSDSGYSIRMQQILLAQAKLESGNFNNTLTRKHHNAFSMLHSKSDPYSIGNYGHAEGRSGYAVYKSLEESVYARLWYSRKWKYPVDVNLEEYVHHIKLKRYFTASENEYLKQMQKLILQDQNLFENKISVIACI